jgi:hypothetical protein
MTAPKDRTGQVVGRLTLLRRVESNRFGHSQWLCRCECGNETVVSAVNLKTTKSCGCLRVVHHQSRTPDWNRWNSMVARCHCTGSRDYPRYGGRGITVCERWRGAQGFVNYMADMGPRPSPKHSVERVDNNRGYEPGNCVWATREVQARNRSDNIVIEHAGQRLVLAQWAAALGINDGTLRSRWERGERGERLLRPARSRRSQPAISV